MLQCKIEPASATSKIVYFTNPKCGHENKFVHMVPYK